jgi:hypothetical protein
VAAGVEIATACTPSAARAAIESYASTPGNCAATCARRSAEVVTTPTNSTFSADAIRGAWKTRPPVP